MVSRNIHKINKFKNKKTRKSGIDYLVYLAGIIGPLLTLPQIYSIWIENQKGVSLITWIAYLFASLIWVVYAIKHKDKPLMIAELTWVILEVFIVVGLLRNS